MISMTIYPFSTDFSTSYEKKNIKDQQKMKTPFSIMVTEKTFPSP